MMSERIRRSFKAKGDEDEERMEERERRGLRGWAETRLVCKEVALRFAREGRSRWALRLVSFLAGGNSSLVFVPWELLPRGRASQANESLVKSTQSGGA